MKNKLLHFLEDMTTQARNAFWSIIVLLVASVLNSIGAFRQASTSGTWQAWVEFGVIVLFFVALLISTFLNLQGRTHQAIGLMIGSFLFTIIARSALTEGLGVFYALIIIAITSVLAYFNLPRKTANRLIIASIVIGGLIVLFDLVVPPYRQTAPPALLKSLPFIASLVFLILLFLIIRQTVSSNIRVKLVTSFTVIALISVAIVGTVIYISYRNQVRQDIRQRLLNIVTITATRLDGDLHSVLQTPEDMQTEAYRQMMAEGDEIIATDPDLIFSYTMRVNEQGQIYFIIDSRRADDTERVAIGTVYDEPSKTLQAFFNAPDRPIVEEEIYTDQYGSVLSAFAPFYRADGSVEGIFGIDIAADAVLERERNVLYLILGTTLGTMVLVSLLGLFLGNLFVGPIVNLSAVAKKITEGDLRARAKIETTDEVGDLAKDFNLMTSQLQETLQGLEQRVAERTKDLATVAEVGTAIATILETDKLLQAVVDLTKNRFNLYHSHIYLLDENGENLVLTAGAGEPGRIMAAEKRSIPLNREQSLVARAARERKGVTVNDVTQSPDFLPNPLLPDTRSELAVPMIVGGNVIGVFDIQSDQVGRFTESDINIQTTLAAQVATSIQNVRSFEQSKSQANLESLVNAIGQKIQRSTSVEDTLQIAIRELGSALGASRVSASIQASRENVKVSES